MRFCFRLVLLLVGLGLAPASLLAASLERLSQPWPNGEVIAGFRGEPFSYPSASPFTLTDIGQERAAPPGAGGAVKSARAAAPAEAMGRLFLPQGASAAHPVPAVVLLHGARGLSDARELTYARQFAAMGLAALAIDVFAARRDRATSFTERLIEITESMALADAYAALGVLAARPEIDGDRIALIGFSYGGMVTLYAAHEQVAELFDGLFELHGRRFAAHASFYAPCVARFEDERATGAPVLMQWGGKDEVIDEERCRETADELRLGGAEVETIVYPEAYHMWDGSRITPWRTPRGLAECDFLVTEEGRIRGRLWGTPFYLAMSDSLSRKLLLAMCSDSDGYLIGANSEVRRQSNAALGRFLAQALR